MLDCLIHPPTALSLLAMALEETGCPARSYTGGQIRILTDSAHNKARIEHIEVAPIRAAKTHVQARVLRIAGRRLQLAGADL